MKTCTKCKEIKCDTEFHKNIRTSDGLADYCKPCKSSYGKRNKYERTSNDKKCCVCNEIKPASEYYSHTSCTDGLQGRCKSCAFLVQQKSKERTGVYGFLKDRLRNAKASAKRKSTRRPGIEFNIDFNYIKELYEAQNGLCSVSGIEMTIVSYATHDFRIKNPHNISFDRIDSSKGYVPGNVQLVCCIYNYMKWDMDMDVFLDACKHVVEHNGI